MMNAVAYISGLLSLILALGMAHLLAGVGEILHARIHSRIYWVHLIWIANLFTHLVIALSLLRR